MEDFLKIPRLRIGALIGKNGEIKKKLEKELDARISVSESGDVEYSSKDPLNELKLKSIIKAIGRGFTSDEALVLLDDAYTLEIVNLKDYSNKSEKTIRRYKSRLIGTDGKSRKMIELLTDTKIVVFGKTVSILGKHDDINTASEAIFMLIEGATHRNVRVFLEKSAREKRQF